MFLDHIGCIPNPLFFLLIPFKPFRWQVAVWPKLGKKKKKRIMELVLALQWQYSCQSGEMMSWSIPLDLTKWHQRIFSLTSVDCIPCLWSKRKQHWSHLGGSYSPGCHEALGTLLDARYPAAVLPFSAAIPFSTFIGLSPWLRDFCGHPVIIYRSSATLSEHLHQLQSSTHFFFLYRI